MALKNILKHIIYREKATSESYIKYLRSIGVSIGDDCVFYAPTYSPVDLQYPWMISIGNHVRITAGVKILTHDYSWSVLKLLKGSGEILGACGHVVIGDNVFIGRNAIITRNVTIGDNVIIGTGSIVTKDCEANSVYAGNPAHKIMDIDIFYEKRKKEQLAEAKEMALAYEKRYGRRPAPEIFHEYFMLFSSEKMILKNSTFKAKIELCGNAEESIRYVTLNPPIFATYDDFMAYCFDEENK